MREVTIYTECPDCSGAGREYGLVGGSKEELFSEMLEMIKDVVWTYRNQDKGEALMSYKIEELERFISKYEVNK